MNEILEEKIYNQNQVLNSGIKPGTVITNIYSDPDPDPITKYQISLTSSELS